VVGWRLGCLWCLWCFYRWRHAEALAALCELEWATAQREGTGAIELAKLHSKWRRERARSCKPLEITMAHWQGLDGENIKKSVNVSASPLLTSDTSLVSNTLSSPTFLFAAHSTDPTEKQGGLLPVSPSNRQVIHHSRPVACSSNSFPAPQPTLARGSSRSHVPRPTSYVRRPIT
jgi:hypothetical protein